MTVDLVVLNTQPPSYLQDLERPDHRGDARVARGRRIVDRPGGVFVRRRDLLDADVLLMLRATARVHLACDGRSLGRIARAARRRRRTRRAAISRPRRRRLRARSRRASCARSACGGAARESLLGHRRLGGARRRRGRHPAADLGHDGHAAERNGADPPAASRQRLSAGSTADGDYEIAVRGDARAAGAVGERHRQPARRIPGHRARRRVHLGGEQLLLPAHAVAQRPGERPGERGDLPARRGERRAVVRDAGADPRTRRRTPCGTAPAPPPSSTSTTASRRRSRWASAGGRAGEALAARGDQPRHDAAPAHASPRTSSGRWACCASTPSTRCSTRFDARAARDPRAQHLRSAVRRLVGVLRAERAGDGVHATAASSSAATARVAAPAGARRRDALGRDRRRARSLRRAAVRARARARRDARARRRCSARRERAPRRARLAGDVSATRRGARGRDRADGRAAGASGSRSITVRTPEPRSTRWSTAGRSTRRSPAGCGRARRSTRAAARTASATSCRT